MKTSPRRSALLVALAIALSLPAVADEKAAPLPPSEMLTARCVPGEMWTVKLQCDVGTRDPVNRSFFALGGQPGVEVCAVVQQQCEPAYFPAVTPGTNHEAFDSPLPSALVVFGLKSLLDIWPGSNPR